ncbi:RluA family pseudouridine synthase [Sulfurospirillum sp. 1612]|uniref:RluA family pseudouridine synthase n=1 Tax=Sulfurospirillum sp. 1612 TaxID=3094835 RepID=UPI002F95B2EF
MEKEKAYKLLAMQEGISNRVAKELIDRGLVYCQGKKINVARGLLEADAKFRVEKLAEVKVIFEDEFLIAVDKPAFLTSDEVEKKFDAKLLHRLDKGTSGVVLLVKDETFQKEAISAFKNRTVYKEYLAVVSGKIVEPISVNEPIISIKKGNIVYSKISKNGKDAITHITPMMVEGKQSKIKVVIETGRTHQIRVHLKSLGFPILGDTTYGGRESKRLMLHAHKISLLGYEFISPEPKEFARFAG